MQFSGFQGPNSHLEHIPMIAKDHNAMDNKRNAMSQTYVTKYSKFLRHIYVVLISRHYSTM